MGQTESRQPLSGAERDQEKNETKDNDHLELKVFREQRDKVVNATSIWSEEFIGNK